MTGGAAAALPPLALIFDDAGLPALPQLVDAFEVDALSRNDAVPGAVVSGL